MSIFSKLTRTDLDGYRRKEPQFEYLDRSARPEASAIRRRIDRWIAAYPAKHRAELIARLSCGDDIAYSSAFFELYLFTYFRRAGFEIQVAPGNKGGTVKAPDFKVSGKGVAFFLEATTAHDESQDERRVSAWKASVHARIDAIQNSHFFVSLEWQEDPTSNPSPARAARKVEAWLPTLDYDDIHRRYAGNAEFIFPALTVDVGGDGKLRILAVPKNHPRPTRGLVGAEGLGIRQVDTLAAVRGALRNKSSRYGTLPLPYIVAINVHANTAEEDEFFDALFGTPEVVVRTDGSHRWRYGGDGGFGHYGHPRARGVSAVLCVRDITPWTIGQEHGRRQMYLFHHPNARNPLRTGIIRLAERWIENGRLETSSGHDVRRILGIPKDWPEVTR